MKKIVYRIRSSIDPDLWSAGGNTPQFVTEERAKTWANIGHLKNHLNQLHNIGKTTYKVHHFQIAEVEIEETITKQTDGAYFTQSVEEAKQAKRKKMLDKASVWQKEREDARKAEEIALLKKLAILHPDVLNAMGF